MEKIEHKKGIKKAVVLAGGLGTRFLPVTLAGAKELIAVGNKPILLYHLEDLVKAGITDVLIVGNRLKEESFKNFINPSEAYVDKIVSSGKLGLLEEYNNVMSKLNITYINQDDRYQFINGQTVENELYDQAGSSIAIYGAKTWANGEPFLVINGDDLLVYEDGHSTSKELIDLYDASNGDYIMYGKETNLDDIWKYSSMVVGDKISNKGAKMLDIVEKPEKGKAPSNIMGFARYIINPDFFERMKTVPARKNGEFCMVDVFTQAAKEGNVSACIFDGTYFDCGSMNGYVLANLYMGLHNSELGSSLAAEADKMIKKFNGKSGLEK